MFLSGWCLVQKNNTLIVTAFLLKWFKQSQLPIASLGGAAFIIALAGILSRLLGFVRDRLLASTFGAGDTLDVYYAAFRLPDFIYGLLVLGALSAAFVPVFTELSEKNKSSEAWQLMHNILYLLLFVLGGAALMGILFAPWIAKWVAPGFPPEKQEQVIVLTRIMLLSPIFLAVSAVMSGVLISFKRFLAYSLAPIFYNVGIIIGIVGFVPYLGVTGLAWGVALGSLLHLLTQYPAVADAGYRHQWPWRGKLLDRATVQVIRLMIPRSLAMAINQVSLLVVTVFASTLAAGSLAVVTLATNIQSVPLGLFGISFAVAAFPVLSSLAGKEAHAEFFETLGRTVRRVLYFVLPLSFFMIIFRAEIVRVVLGTGAFDWEDTILTFQMLGILSVSLFAQSIIPLFVRAFFALQDTKLPLIAAVIGETFHLLLIPFLLPFFSVFGLGMAFSIGTIIQLLILYFALRHKLPLWNDIRFLAPIFRITLIALAAAIVAQLSKGLFALTFDRLDTFIEVAVKLGIGLLIGFGVYLTLSAWYRLPEYLDIKRFIYCRVLRRPETVMLTQDHPEQGDW